MNKKIWLKISFISLLFVGCFALSFLTAKSVKAETLMAEALADLGNMAFNGDEGAGQTFTATATSTLTHIDLWVDHRRSATSIYELCEIDSINETAGYRALESCLSAHVHPDSVDGGNAMDEGWAVLNFTTDFSLENGHFYLIMVNNSGYAGSDYVLPGYGTADNYTGGEYCSSATPWCHQADGGADTIFKVYVADAEYCGDTFCQTASESCYTCESDCGICATNYHYQDTTLFFFSSPYPCVNTTTCKLRYVYNEDVLTQYDYLEIRGLATAYSTSSTFISTSTIIDSSGVLSDKTNGLSYFNLVGTSTLVGYKYYEAIGHLAAYYDAYLGDVAATSTIPYVFYVGWSGTQDIATILAGVEAQRLLENIPTTTLFGMTARDSACSESEWATSSWTTLFKCSALEGVFNILTFFKQALDSVIKTLSSIISTLFPFNLPIKISQSWGQSASVSLPATLDFLDVSDSSGNIYATVPAKIMMRDTDYTFLFFGADMFGLSTSTPRVFIANFKAITPFLTWLMFIFAVWGYAYSVYVDLTNKSHKD